MARLVLLETAGNQRYVFATNRLRENIGASELLYRIGTAFVVRAVAENGGKSYKALAERIDPPKVDPRNGAAAMPRGEPLTTAEFVRDLHRIGTNDPSPLDADGVEIVVATSGKALLLVRDPACAKRIVAAVTLRTLIEAPGAIVRGFIIPVDQMTRSTTTPALRLISRAKVRLRRRMRRSLAFIRESKRCGATYHRPRRGFRRCPSCGRAGRAGCRPRPFARRMRPNAAAVAKSIRTTRSRHR